jgi:histidine ammonia-lyase
MGTSAALKLLKLAENDWQILAIEYLLAAQALDFHDASRAGEGTRRAHALLREQVATWTDDRWLVPVDENAVASGLTV